MITREQAFRAEVFHIDHGALPCTVWHRGGVTYAMHEDASMPGWLTDDCGGFFVPVFRNDGDPDSLRRDSETQWHHITGVNAGDYHTADECPHLRMSAGQPPVSDRSEVQPVLSTGYDEAGYDSLGFDADGYDRNGYDASGYDVNGFDADGYDEHDRDMDGDPRPGSMDAGDLDLADLWSSFSPGRSWGSARKNDFRQYLRGLVRDGDEIDAMEFCDRCDEPAWDDDMNSAAGGNVRICDSCWQDWITCDSCEEKYPADDIYEMLSGRDVCESCRDSYYTYCEDCDGWYHDDDSDSHDHGYDGCCDSPQPEFKIRNDGCDPLANDQRTTVTLPAGTISGEGISAIARYLRDQGHFDVSYDLGELGDEWQSRGGNFAKRLSRLAYQRYQAKITPDILSQVGCIARDHSNAVDVTIEVSRALNESAADWYHEDSCWWGSYGESRCALKTNGGFGIRSFTSPSHSYPSGRAWVLPLRLNENERLVPTFETMTADAFVVFNGYGDLASYAAPRILAHMAGWTYRKISFECSPMYVNSGGYLIAPEHIAEKYTDGELFLSVDQHSRLFETERVNGHE